MAHRTISLMTAFLLALGIGAGAGWAQDVSGYDTSLPIEISADTLEHQQEQKIAIFTGNVDAVQGELNLRADKLIVHYRADSGESNEITLIEAFGNVFLSSPTEMAQGANGVYNLDTDRVELTGMVVLTRGDNVIRGDRLDMDLITGKSRVSGQTPGNDGVVPDSGRVKALFVPSNDDAE